MRALSLTILACLVLIAHCTTELAGTVDDTDSGIRGTVVSKDGVPASGATVLVFVYNDTNLTPTAEVATDSLGSFTVAKLTPGAYNVWAEQDDSLVAYEDSLVVPAHQFIDTTVYLGPPGCLIGSVAVQPNHSTETVTAHILGTHKSVNVNADGTFAIRGLAAGEYTLRFVSTVVDYTPTYREVAVTAGSSCVQIPDTVKMVYTGIPVVPNLTAVYDPYTGVTRLSWKPQKTQFFYDYVIYRDYGANILTPSDAAIASTIDTVFVDTLFAASGRVFDIADRSPTPVRVRYRVAVRDLSLDIGKTFGGAEVLAVSPSALITLLEPRDVSSIMDRTNANLQWSHAPGARGYQVQVAVSSTFEDTVAFTTITDTSYEFPYRKDSAFYWRVRALSPDSTWSPWSSCGNFGFDVFVKTYRMAANQNCKSMIATGDGGYLLAGESSLLGTDQWQVYLLKVDSAGVKQWEYWKDYGYTTMLMSAVRTKADNVYLLVWGQSGSASPSTTFICKLSSAGRELWCKEMYSWTGFQMVPEGADNVVVDATRLVLTPTGQAVSLQKIDGYGNITWEKGPIPGDTVNSIDLCVREAGGFFGLTRRPARDSAGNEESSWCTFSSDGDLLSKTTRTGPYSGQVNLWPRTLGADRMVASGTWGLVEVFDTLFQYLFQLQWTQTEWCQSVEQIAGPALVASLTLQPAYADTSSVGLCKLDNSGSRLWTRKYHASSGLRSDYPAGAYETSSGGFVIGGTTNDKSGKSSDGQDFFLIRTNSDGVSLSTEKLTQ